MQIQKFTPRNYNPYTNSQTAVFDKSKKISMPSFQAEERKTGKEVFYDLPSLKDLYDSEDRLMEYQRKIVNSQNKKIARLLEKIVDDTYSIDEKKQTIAKFKQDIFVNSKLV